MYHFLSGYTAKVAGTEKGVTEPKATFSTCFGAPFLPLAPSRYATMLGERIARARRARLAGEHRLDRRRPTASASRMKIAYTRAMISRRARRAISTRVAVPNAIRSSTSTCPTSCPGVPAEVLKPRNTWSDGAAYDAQAAKLARMFADNFKTFEAEVRAGRVRRRPAAP